MLKLKTKNSNKIVSLDELNSVGCIVNIIGDDTNYLLNVLMKNILIIQI